MSDEQKKLTQISEIGESGLIDRIIKKTVLKNEGSIHGSGDDAAVIDFKNNQVVTSVKILNEGIHFSLVYFPLKHLGYKAVVSSISNIYAMNATPRQILTGISLSNRFSVEAVEEIYDGIHMACNKYGIDLVGGETTSSSSGLSIAVTAIGGANSDHLVYRNGAGGNDLICVTGNLGAAYLGLQLLERERAVFEVNSNVQPDLTGHEYILERQLKPELKVEVLEKLHELNIVPTAMIDVSDGLAPDVLHLCEKSQVGCRIYQDKIPIDSETEKAAEEFNLESTTCALNGGEDYELLFTVPIDLFEKVKEISNVSVIGHIAPYNEGCKLITINNEAIELISAKGGLISSN